MAKKKSGYLNMGLGFIIDLILAIIPIRRQKLCKN